MKSAPISVRSYDINEVNESAGKIAGDNEFFVYDTREVANHERMFRPSRSSHFTFYLHNCGNLQVKVNLVKYTVSEKCLFIVAPEIVREIVREDEDCEGITMGFTPEFFGNKMMFKKHVDHFSFLSSQSDPLTMLTDQECDVLTERMLALKGWHRDDAHPFKEEMMQHGFNLLMFELAAIVKKYRGNTQQKLTRKEELLAGFFRLLSEHFTKERSVHFYADSLFITAKHLSKTIKELTSKTCGELIDDMVIVEAKILLSDYSLSVAQVADQLHFSDQFFFSKFFKNHTGLNPTEYKSSV